MGRYRISKLRLTIPDAVRTLTAEDVLSTIDYLINLELDVGAGPASTSTTWVAAALRSLGSCWRPGAVGLNRLERIIKERMTVGETSRSPRPSW